MSIVRVDIPAGGSALAAFRAFRAYVEEVAKAKGTKLDPAWYLDGPEDRPGLYRDVKKSEDEDRT